MRWTTSEMGGRLSYDRCRSAVIYSVGRCDNSHSTTTENRLRLPLTVVSSHPTGRKYEICHVLPIDYVSG